jgi:hypothetical protein
VAQGLTIFDAIKRDITRDRQINPDDGEFVSDNGDVPTAPAQLDAPE